MQAVIVNSGIGSRMGELTKDKHKSMVEIKDDVPLIIHQIKTLAACGIKEFVITTGYMADKLQQCIEKYLGHIYAITYVYNPKYNETNYIYSLYLAQQVIIEDTLLMHGDLYFTEDIIKAMMNEADSSVVIDTTLPLPEKDFKASMDQDKVLKIGVYVDGAGSFACQPLYKLNHDDMKAWMEQIKQFCEKGNTKVYAEEALNELLDTLEIKGYDLKGKLCMEIDMLEDLTTLREKLMNDKEGE
jgi:phosphoenolpyruvate phosphomutase